MLLVLKRIALFAGLMLLATVCLANETRKIVAIIDTGIKLDSSFDGAICENGLVDVTGRGPVDVNGHGTFVAKIILKSLNKSTHCLHIIKYTHLANNPQLDISSFIRALASARRISPFVVNISVSGNYGQSDTERNLILGLSKSTKIVVSAGNDGLDLDKDCIAFPACYDIPSNFYVVSSSSKDGIHSFSNYGGTVNATRNGNLYRIGDIVMSGTSMAAAIFTGDLIK